MYQFMFVSVERASTSHSNIQSTTKYARTRAKHLFSNIALADIPPIKFFGRCWCFGFYFLVSAECHLRKIYFVDKGVYINHINRNSFPQNNDIPIILFESYIFSIFREIRRDIANIPKREGGGVESHTMAW